MLGADICNLQVGTGMATIWESVNWFTLMIGQWTRHLHARFMVGRTMLDGCIIGTNENCEFANSREFKIGFKW